MIKCDKTHDECTEYKTILITLSWLPVELNTWLDVVNAQYVETRSIYEFTALFNEYYIHNL
jgi:hypothetical protein